MLLCKVVMVLSGHTHSVTGIKWGGEGLIYTASQDRTIKVWRAKDVREREHKDFQLLCLSLPLSLSLCLSVSLSLTHSLSLSL